MDLSRLSRNLKFKYFLDRLLAYPLLFFASPFVLLAAWIIKLDGWISPENSGSVFYTEPRKSAKKVFQVLKFRTVTKKDIDWIKQCPEKRSITWAKKRTNAGRIIVKWYFDELPQIFNIIKGEMSFVGPRPHVFGVYAKEIQEGCFYREIMKAGLFGVPQACKKNPQHIRMFDDMGKREKSENEMLNSLDGIYARECMRRSLLGVVLFDWEIFARFVVIFLEGKG